MPGAAVVLAYVRDEQQPDGGRYGESGHLAQRAGYFMDLAHLLEENEKQVMNRYPGQVRCAGHQLRVTS